MNIRKFQTGEPPHDRPVWIEGNLLQHDVEGCFTEVEPIATTAIWLEGDGIAPGWHYPRNRLSIINFLGDELIVHRWAELGDLQAEPTPGPWKVFDDRTTRTVLRVVSSAPDSRNSEVAVLYCARGDSEFESPVGVVRGDFHRIANANLLAAAPELLAALKAAEAFIGGFEGDEAQEGTDALLEQIRTAISKAEGRIA
jgi:hypothetical protein